MPRSSALVVCPYCSAVKLSKQGLCSHIAQKSSCHRAFEASLEGVAARSSSPRMVDDTSEDISEETVDQDVSAGDWDYDNEQVGNELDPPLQPLLGNRDTNTRPEETEHAHGSKRVRVNEELDDEAGGLPRQRWIEDFEGTGQTYGQGQCRFEKLYESRGGAVAT